MTASSEEALGHPELALEAAEPYGTASRSASTPRRLSTREKAALSESRASGGGQSTRRVGWQHWLP